MAQGVPCEYFLDKSGKRKEPSFIPAHLRKPDVTQLAGKRAYSKAQKFAVTYQITVDKMHHAPD